MDCLGGGLWEVRSSLGDHIARTFFIVVDEEIILLHGIIKKSRTAPKQELDLARKRVVALELQQILEKEHITRTRLASRMKTSRASLDRMLDPTNPFLTVATLGKAAAALGRKVELRFIPA